MEIFNIIGVENALKTVLESIKPLSKEEVGLTAGLDRVLAEDIYADIDIPEFDNSAMDGYAVRYENTTGASKANPKLFDVIYDLRAGFLTSSVVDKGQAVRIMTGAAIPRGADSVVMVEFTEREKENRVRVFKEATAGENIRKRAEGIKKGELVISSGSVLNSAHIGLLASLGRPKIKVARKPKVAILATGDELIEVDEKLMPGKLRNSNTYTLYSQVLKCGCVPNNLGIAGDKPKELEKKIRKGLDSDLILTSGGVSVGDYDFVKLILAKLGTDIKFWKVRMRPGKPLVFGTISGSPAKGGEGTPIFGLPGNPVSSMISFEVFVRPAILKMLGQETSNRKEVSATLQETIKKKKGLKYFLRAETRWNDGEFLTRTTGPQGSGMLKSMALADSLIILPEEEEKAEKGAKVRVVFFE